VHLVEILAFTISSHKREEDGENFPNQKKWRSGIAVSPLLMRVKDLN